MTKRINLENVKWYADTEHAYSDLGIDKATVYRAYVETKRKYYEITVYPLALIYKDAQRWDYKIVELTENGKIIDEYDAGAENYDHFPTAEKAKNASLVTLKEMLGGY